LSQPVGCVRHWIDETEGGNVTQANHSWLAEQFEGNRGHLRAVAYRMLGASGEADDAVQEAWLRLSRSEPKSIQNLRAWLTTVVARVCLDMLRARAVRREDDLPDEIPGAAAPLDPPDPEQEALLAESVGLALLVVLDRLSPAERVAFILHDSFSLPFDQIGAVLGRSAAAARQLASRARRAVRGAKPAPTGAEQRAVVEAFLAALRAGDVQGLLSVLDPDVVVHADAAAAGSGAAREIRGAVNWARGAVAFARHARFVSPALVDGQPALVSAPRGRLQRVVRFQITAGRITAAEIIADPGRVRAMNVSTL
jgi:RNA polymerase sigma-70 factor (ECF subfamily)